MDIWMALIGPRTVKLLACVGVVCICMWLLKHGEAGEIGAGVVALIGLRAIAEPPR